MPRRAKPYLAVWLGDAHYPYEDPAAMRCVAKMLKRFQPRETYMSGDWLDCEIWSSHDKNYVSEHSDLFTQEEVAPLRDWLDLAEGESDELIYFEGNHEWRITRTLIRHGLLAIQDLVSVRKLVEEGRRKKFTWVPYSKNAQDCFQITPHLLACHGWTHARNAASVHLSKARNYSIVYGHTHRKQYDAARDPVSGRIYEAWTPGCLSELQPKWRHTDPSNWSQGFSLIWIDPSDWSHTTYNVTINEGKCVLPDGTKIDGNGRGRSL